VEIATDEVEMTADEVEMTADGAEIAMVAVENRRGNTGIPPNLKDDR
jgi:hypothetical protein